MENKLVSRFEDLNQRAGNEDFDCIRVIGKGSYGEVWLAKHKKDKKQYVLKKMNLGKASKRERKSAEQEAKLLSKLKHPNIVSYKDSFETDGFLYIAMQYCEGGDLYARLKEQKGIPLEERQVVEWFVQIAMALQYMHERNILHRDLKTQNIFLTKSKIIKVGDLGIARILESASSMATTLIGTPYYMSPELFSNKPYNHKSDVWALGCCVYEMTTLKHAFNAKDMNSLVYKILKGRIPLMPCQYSSELLILMRSMLHQDPEKRPSVNRILRDPYIKKNIAIFLEDTKRNNRQSNQSSSRQTTSSVSRPSSASVSRKDSASSIVEVESVSQAENISNSDVQRHKHDLKAVTDKTKENIKSFSNGDAQETPQSVKEINSPKQESAPRKKNFLRNHVKIRQTKQTELTEGSQKDNDLGKLPLGQARDNEKVVSHLEVKSIKTEGVEMEAQDREWHEIVPEVKKSVFSQAEGNEKSAPRLQIQSPKNESALQKNNVLWDQIKSSKAEKAEMEVLPLEKPSFILAKNNEEMNPSLEYQRSENKTRPLPVPRVKASAGLPQHREDKIVSADFSRSSSVSSSTEDKDMPRSLPNMSARERRRQQKNDCAESKENSNSARIKLRRVPERAASDKVTKSERRDLQVEAFDSQKASRQPSTSDSTSSDDSQKVTGKESATDKEVERNNKEMNNFICLLNSTLQMNNVVEEEEELVPVKVESVSSRPSSLLTPTPQQPSEYQHFHRSVSMPSVETLTDTSRLTHRIRILHTDCVRGVGLPALTKAFEILDKIDEDEVEPKLVDLLGKDKFDEYAGKIWQLKFCEESLFETP